MSDRKAYFFLGGNYVRYDVIDDRIDDGYPRALPGGWTNLPFSAVDAGVNWGNGQIYLFAGTEYARITLANNNTMDAGYPRPILGNWGAMPFATIDAAVNVGNGKAFFFLGDQYVSYDIAGDTVDPGFPRPIGPDWPGLFPSGVDAAVNWGNGKLYLFFGDQYVRFDIAAHRVDDAYPLETSSQWPAPIAGRIDAAMERSPAPPTTLRCSPVFESDYWNDGADVSKQVNPRSVQKNDNCYNYATDIPNRTFAQPGQASGHPIAGLADCTDAAAGALSDGLQPAGAPTCAGCCHPVALVVWPNRDYHWYRLDSGGTWSHKPGSTPATDRDSAGNPITDPVTAARGPYTQFCGFFCVCHGGAVHIVGPKIP
ncbi:MAG: hemopexin repeat-containing protein [Mycobacteriales bacterium]